MDGMHVYMFISSNKSMERWTLTKGVNQGVEGIGRRGYLETRLSKCILYNIDLKMKQKSYILKILKQNKTKNTVYWDCGLNTQKMIFCTFKIQ